MKHAIVIFLALGLALTGEAQGDYVEDWNPDADGDDNVGVSDLLALLSVFSENDEDGDGIWDSQDDCIGVYDACGVCNGEGEDADEDGVCDDVDDCVGAYDECGVCNGPGPNIPVIDEILYETDSVFIEVLGEWYVFEYAADTLFTYACPINGCTDETASNYDPEAVIEDGSCAYGPLECGGASTVTFDGYTYNLVAIGDQCWFAENLRTELYQNGDSIPGELSNNEWGDTSEGAQAILNNDTSNLADFGRLYNWYAVDDERGLCPTGWHVPTDEQFMTLEIALGMSESEASSGNDWRGTDQGTQLKTSFGWANGGNGTNASGFSALPAEFRSSSGSFFCCLSGAGASFWTSSTLFPDNPNAWFRSLDHANSEIYRAYNNKRAGYSVRCLKDANP